MRLGSIVKCCYYGLMTRSSVDLEEAGLGPMGRGARGGAGGGQAPRLRAAGARGAALRARPSGVRGRGNRIRAQARPDSSVEQLTAMGSGRVIRDRHGAAARYRVLP